MRNNGELYCFDNSEKPNRGKWLISESYPAKAGNLVVENRSQGRMFSSCNCKERSKITKFQRKHDTDSIKILPFRMTPAPKVFMKILKTVLAVLRFWYSEHQLWIMAMAQNKKTVWLWSRDVMRQGSGSTPVQVMTCCLTAPNHYMNRCRLIIREVLWHSPECHFTEYILDIYS